MIDSIFGNPLFQFLVGGVLIQYVGRKIVGDWIISFFKRSDRRMTIWNHYVNPAGHNGEVIECGHQKCSTL